EESASKQESRASVLEADIDLVQGVASADAFDADHVSAATRRRKSTSRHCARLFAAPKITDLVQAS
ncbi:MAG TPA: hypothetical protein VMT30_02930, partial [Candidatus Saccharimonadia bacterium]|nr:hypothetical protein [Candidatus Saccharimonadia bacterium]